MKYQDVINFLTKNGIDTRDITRVEFNISRCTVWKFRRDSNSKFVTRRDPQGNAIVDQYTETIPYDP